MEIFGCKIKKKLFVQLLLVFLLLPLIAKDYSFKFLQNKTWVLSEYYDILYDRDKYKLIELFPDVEENYIWRDENGENYYPYTWESPYFSDTVYRLQFEAGVDISPEKFSPDDKIIRIGDIIQAYFQVLNESVYFTNKNSFTINYQAILFQTQDKPILPFPATEEGKVYYLKIIFDGDYLNFYIDDIFVHKFCIMDTETLTNYSSLIVNGECDLAKVSWPRHADGTSDYDGKILIPEPFLIDDVIPTQNKIEKSILQQKNDNKIETVIIDVKNIQQGIINQKFGIYMRPKGLQISEINPVAKVKIIEIGPEDTIENIKSNWIKIKITNKVLNSRNENCKGATGWIFGGCLN